jgi:hypothetical protein
MPKLLPLALVIAYLAGLSAYTTVQAQPVINHFSPVVGPAGSSVVITGTGFSSSATGNTVFMGAARAVVTAASAGSLTVTVPSGATFQPITVTTGGLTARSALGFTVTYPAGNPEIYTSAFAARQEQTTLSQDAPQSTIAADIDGDGRPDIVNTTTGKFFFSVYRNLGSGANAPAYFDAGTNINMLQYTMATAVADIDGDGRQDVVITNQTTSTISVFRNTSSPGTISFDPVMTIPCGVVTPAHLAIGDLDGDGKPEVVLTGDTKIVLLKNNSSPGTIQLDSATSIDVTQATDVAINDFDGDGKADIVVPYWGGRTGSGLLFLLNTSSPGSFSFVAQPTLDVLIDGVEPLIGDMDGDGRPDLGFTSYSIPAITLFRNTSTVGNIRFETQPNIRTSAQAINLSLGDIDGDGLPEISAVIQSTDYSKNDTVVILKNTSTPGNLFYTPKLNLVTQPVTASAFIADIDGDGKPDLVSGQRVPGKSLSVFRNRDNEPFIRTFSPATAFSGSIVTLKGVSFTGATAISFGGLAAASFTVVNDSTITATVASGGKSGDIGVTTGYGTFSLPGFEWKTAETPVINSFTPESAPTGASVTITGLHFDPAAANNTVFFGGMKATVKAASATSLTVTVPTGTTYGHLSVTTNRLTAWSRTFFSPSFSGVINTFSPTSYAQELDFPNGDQAYSITMDETWTGDVDGDGRPDVLTRGSNDMLFTYRNTGKTDSAMLSVKENDLQFFMYDFALADLDGDGKQDIVYCDQDYGAVYYTNNSSPGAIKFVSAGHMPDRPPFFFYEHVVIGDVDGDGKPDLIFTKSSDSNVVVVYRNSTVNGVISFANGVSYTLGRSAGANCMPYVADLDGDNKPELIMTNARTNVVTVLKNNCTPGILNFGAQQNFAAGTQPMQLAVGDLDGDGLPELAVSDRDPSAGSNATVTVLQNKSTSSAIAFGTGQTLTAATGDIAFQSSFGDMDGDGKADLIVATGKTVALFPNTSAAGKVSFGTRADYPGVAMGPIAADLNGDGYTDIVGVNGSSVSLFKSLVNVSPDMYTPPVITALTPSSGPGGSSVTITGQHFSTTASNNTVFFGGIKAVITAATATSLTVKVPVGAPFMPVSVTRQGLTAWSSQRWMTIYSSGAAPFDKNVVSRSADTTTENDANGAYRFNATVVSADLDGDGKADMVVTNSSLGNISVYRNDGSGSPFPFTNKTDYLSGARALTSTLVMDVDGDGKLDLVAYNTGLVIMLNTSTPGAISFAAAFNPVHNGNYGAGGVIADFDGDGGTDILTDGYLLLRNITANGVVDFLPVTGLFPVTEQPSGVTVEDFNGDGRPDVALTYGDVRVFTNASTPGNLKFIATASYPGGTYVTSGDFDNDQRPDMVVLDNSANKLMLFHNNGDGSFSSVSRTAPYDSRGLTTGDLDGDGYPDIMTLVTDAYNFQGLNILKNTGTKGKMSFADPVYFAIDGGVSSIAVSDWNGDGAQDLLLTSPYPSRLYAYAGRPFHPVISDYTPKLVSPGDKLVITGYNFTGVSSVSLGGVAASSFSIDSDHQITATVGEGTEGNITVTNSSAADTLPGLLFRAPVISSVTPLNGKVGTVLQVSGDHFSAVPANNKIFFGSVKGEVTSASTKRLMVKAPAGYSFAPLSLSTFGETVSAGIFGYRFASLGNAFSAGSFAPHVDVTSSDKPGATAAGDLDGDGLPDLVAGNAVYRNTGGPGMVSLGVAQSYTGSDQPVQLLLEDIDGDGRLDIIRIDRGIQIFLNTSTGAGAISFAPAFVLAVNYDDPVGLAVSDLDGDGKKDIIVASSFGETDVNIYTNKSVGSKLAFALSPSALNVVGRDMSGLVVTDLDGDKKPDIIVLNYIDQNLRVFRNMGNADTLYFSPQGPILSTDGFPMSAIAADLDGDGLPEVVVREEGLLSSSGILVFGNTSSPGAIALTARQKMNTSSYNSGVSAADWDGDGKPDLAAPNANGGDSINVYKNITASKGAIIFQPAVSYSSVYGVAMLKDVDWDADGKPDMVMVNKDLSPGAISIIRNSSGEARIMPQGANPVTGPVVNISSMDSAGQTLNGAPYVLRHYDIQPENNPSTATARVSLYFTQNDFNIYNGTSGHGLDLPKGPGDAAGIANLRVFQYHGFSATGQPGSYSGNGLEIDPADADIIWDATAQLWAVSFDVNGFSGFFLSSIGFPYQQVPAPVVLATGAVHFCKGDSVDLVATGLPDLQWYKDGQAIPGADSVVFVALQPGKYTATVSNNGVLSPASTAIEVRTDMAAPKPVIILQNGALNSSAASGIQWYKDGQAIPGATKQVFQPTADGQYTISVNNGTCPATVSDAYAYEANAIIRIDDTHYLTVGPNPFRDQIVLRYEINNVTTLHLRVYDMQGRLCYSNDAVSSGAQVDLASLASGVYVASMFSADNNVRYSIRLKKGY